MINPYKEAKLAGLKELKALVLKLMAQQGEGSDEEMDLPAVMEQAENESNPDPDAGEGEGEEEAMSELQQMKKDYFKPKPKPRNPGTAVMVASMKQASGSLKPSFSSPAKTNKHKGYK